ncbi:MAG: adenylyltransferase/cytidyltransferase family protein [Asgard group archaeon]|nr:adenylyltransferase/cytidyltransferase family protein [Asgard group archaeon]
MTNSKIIFINGCFDLLHPGHFHLLNLACSLKQTLLNSKLVIALDSDLKIKKDKGLNRPFFTYEEREKAIQSLGEIDLVTKFNTNKGLYALIKSFRPFYMIKGVSWKGNVVGEEYCENIIFVDEKKFPYSSTMIAQRIMERHREGFGYR